MNKEIKVWFTSDTHFGHKKIMEYANRPFDTVEKMDEELIRAWNSVVGQDDIVYHMGDFALTNSNKTKNILNRLNGRLILIVGNHEKSVMDKEAVRERFISIKDKLETYINKQFIVMCHYGMRVWNKSHHGAWMLYGHSHDSMEHEAWGRSMDVGVDSAARILGEYRPFSFEEIKRIMDKREDNPVDHHVAKRK
jgi:calcineurin-like phosphoesterase family protein